MRGTVVRGKAPSTDTPVQLTPAEESELEAAVNEIRAGRFVDGEDLLKDLEDVRMAERVLDAPGRRYTLEEVEQELGLES